MSSQRKILNAIAVVVIIIAIAAVYAWHRSNRLALQAAAADNAVSLTTIISNTTPAEAVSNTTFDIISPTAQPTSVVSGEAMPGSSGY